MKKRFYKFLTKPRQGGWMIFLIGFLVMIYTIITKNPYLGIVDFPLLVFGALDMDPKESKKLKGGKR